MQFPLFTKSRSTFVVLCLFFMSTLQVMSCSDKKESPPVPLGKMQQILLELQYAEVYATGLYPDSLKKKFDKNLDSLAVFYQSIFKHHQLSEAEFKTAMEWYKAHPVQLDSLYARVLSNVNEQQAILEKEKANKKDTLSAKDSIKSVDTSYVKKQRDSLRAKLRSFDTTSKTKTIKP